MNWLIIFEQAYLKFSQNYKWISDDIKILCTLQRFEKQKQKYQRTMGWDCRVLFINTSKISDEFHTIQTFWLAHLLMYLLSWVKHKLMYTKKDQNKVSISLMNIHDYCILHRTLLLVFYVLMNRNEKMIK